MGVATSTYVLNTYSANPTQVKLWLTAASEAYKACGLSSGRTVASQQERDSLRSLRRGVFSTRAICAGERLTLSSIDLAIPTSPGQVTANDLSKYANYYAVRDIPSGEPIHEADVRRVDTREKSMR